MFEKESEEWRKSLNYEIDNDTFYNIAIPCIEFGYNKSNEWHYVKDEKDLPTDKKEYLLLLGSGIRTFGFYNGKWWESWKGDLSWQEVKAYFFVPVPELKENE